MRFGFHVSIAGGFAKVRERAEAVGCESMQLFSSNPRGWAVAALDDSDVAAFRNDMRESDISPVFVHAPYLPNLAAPRAAQLRNSVRALAVQMERCTALGIDYLICHVGKALGTKVDRALARVAESVNKVLSASPKGVKLLLENMAGMGTEVGCRFEQIAAIVDMVEERTRVGVVLDTAHAFEAGYEFRTRDGLNRTLREFDQTVGFGRLHALHLNDSRTEFGARVDRHWHIGQGHIGLDGFRLIVNHPLLRSLPAIMETPRTGARDDRRNMKTIRGLVK